MAELLVDGDELVLRLNGAESRSAGHRAAPSVTAMEINLHGTVLPHDAPDASPAFDRDRPEVVPVVLLLRRAGPG